MKFVFFEDRNGFPGRGFDALLPALVIDHREGAISRYRVQLLGNEQVDIFVMLF